MRKIVLLFMVMALCFVGCEKAAQAAGLDVTLPLETGITGLWFPEDNAIAAGVNFTVARIKYVDETMPTLSKISVDLDGVVAKEVNANKDTLYGPGVKVNYDVDVISNTGFTFKPSLGLTVLKNADNFDMQEVMQDWRFAIYGNIILYKF